MLEIPSENLRTKDLKNIVS